MRTPLRCRPFFISLLILLFTCSDLHAQAKPDPGHPTRGWLTVETIMRDPKWMGTSPSQVFWSEDGKKIYFSWRQGDDKGDSLYVVDARGGTPGRVALAERKKLPSRYGDYNKEKTKKVYSRDGDILLLDIKRNVETPLTQTVGAESNPQFSFDEKKITFQRDGNLYIRDLERGAEIQLTNLRPGTKTRESSNTELQKFLEQQQMELFDVLKKRKEDREAQKKLQELLEVQKPKPYYIGQKNAFAFVLSPDERYVTFILSQSASDAKNTIVPNYVTESGFTEDIPGRTKVGEPQTSFEFFVYNVALDSVMQVKPDSIAGIIAPKAPSDTTKKKPSPRTVFYNGPYWSDDGKEAFVQLFSQDNKDRWLVNLDAEKARFMTLLDRQTDSAWIGGPGIRAFGMTTTVGWMPARQSGSGGPDSKRIYFQSEEDGYSHLYTVDADGKNKTQLTKGKFEVYNPFISRDKKRWYFTSNEVHFGERHFYTRSKSVV